MPRLVLMSDTHLFHKDSREPKLEVPDGDILIHSGDATYQGRVGEFHKFYDWYTQFPHRHKIFVAGNHDWVYEKDPDLGRSLVPRSVTYLQDDMVEIEGLKIYGTPWTPYFLGWAFNLHRGHRLREKWNKIPRGIDVLVTHGPPMGICDLTYDGEHVGCADLKKVVFRVKPRLHVFGHIHMSGGQQKTEANIKFVNAAVLGEDYKLARHPIVVDL